MVLIRVCAWCQKYKGYDVCEGDEPVMVSHGICKECAERQFIQVPGLGMVRLADAEQVAAGKAEELAREGGD